MAANSISNVYVQTFQRNVRHLAQQGDSLLMNWVQIAREESVSHNWERLGTLTMRSKSRNSATPIGDTPSSVEGDNSIAWSRRQSVIANYHTGELVEQDDPVQMLVDPNSAITHAMAMSARRRIDDTIIAAAVGASRDGAGGSVSFVSGQIINSSYTAEISFDLVAQVYELFLTNNISPEEEKVFVIGPKQLRKLQQLVEYTSSDYVNVKSLAERGYAPNWMGFTWIVSNRLLAGGGAGTLDCFAMTRRALGLHIAKDIWARVAEDPSRSFAWRIYTALSLGAVRVEDEQLVWCRVADTVT